MKIRKLATVPLRTDDRDAPLVVRTPRSEQVAKKTENAANAKIKTMQHDLHPPANGQAIIFLEAVLDVSKITN